MKTIVCLFALIAVIAANIVPMQQQLAPTFIRKTRAAENPQENAPTQMAEANSEDMDGAETFGFGYHKHIHIVPSYGGFYGGGYPYYGGYGYSGYGGYGGYSYVYGYPYYY
ncbi:uncharacterized protein LOC128736218 [Sabethes cyaneus]|uniref:uncharacterized protein LOC128736218 n=1 Tax=Sabethes cyaneus TaxID=53552 RepID=UPI00237EAF5F|nr:uncharacterized protein LOC128736218 [Sabethes cyaneus]